MKIRQLVPILAWLGTLMIALFFTGCGLSNANGGHNRQQENRQHTDLDKYWYQGKAEVASYELTQARYSDEHPGDAVLVFVSEDFLPDKQVKNESYTSDKSAKVLKANMLRKFTTGIYDYAIMTSVFTPADEAMYPNTFKVTMSAQDWCGQSFMQVNHRQEAYQLQQFSYFEQEGDRESAISDDVWLEDELWTRLRMNPAGLPDGEITILPSLMTLRLLHLDNEPLPALASTSDYAGDEFDGQNLKAFSVEYRGIPRSLSIVYEAAAPYKIVGWTETSRGGLRTIARKKAELFTDYWAKHGLEDSTLRAQLKL